MNIPRDVRKADLYDYVETLRNGAMVSLNEKYKKKVTDLGLVDDFKNLFKPTFDELSEAIRKVSDVYSKVEVLNMRGNGSILNWNLSNALDRVRYYAQSESDTLSSAMRMVRAIIDSIDEILVDRIEGVLPPELLEKVKTYNNFAVEYKKKRDELIEVYRKLNLIIKNATRGSDAWKALEQTQLNLAPLRMKLAKGSQISSVPSTVIKNIELLNSVALDTEETNDEDVQK
ncbi:hypothetical protein [Bacillus subtilis]|uniref:hypothetical protein n=1 Tax=Bacillus subtilis TaxID=1423 RepID=UPI0025C9AF19|nr:hypothetical protein [Bacillus subtilis]GLI90567.1 hypothetical protein ANABIO4_39190 [Bacillus subtilis]